MRPKISDTMSVEIDTDGIPDKQLLLSSHTQFVPGSDGSLPGVAARVGEAKEDKLGELAIPMLKDGARKERGPFSELLRSPRPGNE